jgi:four helix bundle protein
MPSFHHSRLIVYRRSIDFVALAAEINSDIQPSCAFLRDQLGRAATSIALNVAEGSGEFSRGEKARFYRIARRSATECAAILEALEAFGFNRPEMLATGRELLHEIIAMLTVMAKPADLKSRVKSPRKGPGEETGA